MELLGSQLKKIRESKNITLETLRAGTKLDTKIIRAIEENQFDSINPTYLKGFLKIYCKFLGIDYNEYIHQVKNPQIKIHEQPIPIQKDIQQKKEIPDFKEVKDELKKKESTDFKPRWVILIFTMPLVIIAGIILMTPRNTAKIKPLPNVKVEKKQPNQKKPILSQKQNQDKKPLSPAIKGNLNLTVNAKQNSWLRIKCDGETFFEGVLKKGSTEIWSAKEKLELAVGNAGGLGLQLNGRILPSLGARGQVIKRIIITKDGIDISK